MIKLLQFIMVGVIQSAKVNIDSQSSLIDNSPVYFKVLKQYMEQHPEITADLANNMSNAAASKVPVLQGEDCLNSPTNDNCYLLNFSDNLSPETISSLKKVLLESQATISVEFTCISGVSICFPSGTFPKEFVQSIKGIESIEHDCIVSRAQVQEKAPWALDKLDNNGQNDGKYSFDLTGKGVTIYFVDSGCLVTHPELKGRATIGYSVDPSIGPDCDGHGTLVTSMAAGLNTGVAKEANIVVAQVLDCEGNGKNSDLIAALDWIMENASGPAVVNMSVGGKKSLAVEKAVSNAVAQGLVVVTAAGNNSDDACNYSPGGCSASIAVGSTDVNNRISSFSNYGSCVDIFAPGQDVLTGCLPKVASSGYSFVSGTSLSCPIVSGIIALYLEENPSMTPDEVKQRLYSEAAEGVVKGNIYDSPNKLVQASKYNGNGTEIVKLYPPGTLPEYPPSETSNENSLVKSSKLILFIWIFIGYMVFNSCLKI